MAAKVVSIEIGQQVIKICEIEYKKKNPHVYRCVTIETPMEFVNDGYLVNSEALAELLVEQMKNAGIKNDKVVFTVASTKIANREVVIPDVKENRIRDILMANANDYFPIDIEEYNITHVTLEKVEGVDGKQIRLLVLAAPGDMIKGYYELADQMKVEIEAIDYIGNSAYQILRHLGYTDVNLTVQMNEQNTIISLVENNSLLLQRTLPYGANMLAQSVISHPAFEVTSIKEALELLNKQSILKAQFVDIKTDYLTFSEESEVQSREREYEEAKEEVTNSLRLLVSNINRIIDYFVSQYHGKRITEIVVAGDGAYIRNIETLITNEIGIETELLNAIPNVSFVKEAADLGHRKNHYLACIGAAIAPVDFTPKERAKKEMAASTMRFPLFILMLCTFGSILIFLFSVIMYRSSKREYNELQQKISDIADINTIYTENKETKKALESLKEMEDQTKNASENLPRFFEELERKTPKGCVISALQFGDKTITLQVKANNKTLCAKYIEMIKTIDQLQSVSTNGFTAEDSKQKDGPVTVTIVCTLK